MWASRGFWEHSIVQQDIELTITLYQIILYPNINPIYLHPAYALEVDTQPSWSKTQKLELESYHTSSEYVISANKSIYLQKNFTKFHYVALPKHTLYEI